MTTQHEEASTLGLKPGQWPDTLEFEGKTYRQREAYYDRVVDLKSVLYRADDGNELVVFND